MTARVIAAAVAVTLLVGVSVPPLGAQQPVAAPPVAEPTPEAQPPIPAAQPEPAMTAPAPQQTTAAPSTVAPAAPAAVQQGQAAATPEPAAPRPVAQPEAPAVAAGPESSSHSHRSDAYDVAGGVVTVLKAPFNAVLCGLGGVVGVALFVVTFGSGYRAAARAVEEGCSGPWIVTGDDLRPDRGRPAARLSDLHPAELEGR